MLTELIKKGSVGGIRVTIVSKREVVGGYVEIKERGLQRESVIELGERLEKEEWEDGVRITYRGIVNKNRRDTLTIESLYQVNIEGVIWIEEDIEVITGPCWVEFELNSMKGYMIELEPRTIDSKNKETK